MKIAVSVSDKEKARGKESPYWKALVAAGARPEELELVTASDARRFRTENFDGVLLAGGEDVDPALYAEKKNYENVHVNRARDDFEMALLDGARGNALPVLGICRGAQVINVKFGGTLYQDLKSDTDLNIEHKQAAPRNEATHGVTLTDSESRLAEAFRGSCRVNSMHHQAIRRVGRGLKVVAYSEDGAVEAVEAADQPFFLAVQWHPEEMVHRPEQRKIFERFLEKCREVSARRTAEERK
jgi:putative glutamine amidotransferase